MKNPPDMTRDNRHVGDPGTAEFQLDKYPFYLLNRAVSRYNVVIESRLRTIGLDIPNWRVLMVLGEDSPRSIGRIATACVINLSTMMRIIDRMKSAGFLTSSISATDGRVTEVSLTPQGVAKLEMARTITAPIYHTVIDGFSAREFDQMIGYLGRLYDNLGRIQN